MLTELSPNLHISQNNHVVFRDSKILQHKHVVNCKTNLGYYPMFTILEGIPLAQWDLLLDKHKIIYISFIPYLMYANISLMF